MKKPLEGRALGYIGSNSAINASANQNAIVLGGFRHVTPCKQFARQMGLQITNTWRVNALSIYLIQKGENRPVRFVTDGIKTNVRHWRVLAAIVATRTRRMQGGSAN
jgi:hypothetical protein